MIYHLTHKCLRFGSSIRIQKLLVWSVVFFFCGMFIFSCQEDKNIVPGTTLLDDYFPIQTGQVRTYVIDSITYDYDGDLQRIVIDTSQYYIQERILEATTINSEEWYRIGRFQSPALKGDYQLTDYIYERKESGRVLRKEGNLTFITLASPLGLFEEWDGTAYFDASMTTRFVRGEVLKPYDEWSYIYLNNWENFMVQEKAYRNVIQINQRDTLSIPSSNDNGMISPENQLFYHLANEYYAPQTGLIEKEEYHLTSICASSNVDEFQVFCDTTTIFENAERGYIFHKRLISIE